VREITFPGMRIGLLGGSFNPAHDGHRHISLIALRRLQLDRVWWLVSPQNPLKSSDETEDYDARCAYARDVARHPRIVVSDFERRHGVNHTWRTLSLLKLRRPGASFVWLMGADNLAGFHRWERWRDIARMTPIAVFARPGDQVRAPLGFAAQYLSGFRLEEEDAKLLASRPPPAWVYLTETLHPASSTAIRRRRASASAGVKPDGA